MREALAASLTHPSSPGPGTLFAGVDAFPDFASLLSRVDLERLKYHPQAPKSDPSLTALYLCHSPPPRASPPTGTYYVPAMVRPFTCPAVRRMSFAVKPGSSQDLLLKVTWASHLIIVSQPVKRNLDLLCGSGTTPPGRKNSLMSPKCRNSA